MKYEVIKGCVINGSSYQAGSIVTIDDRRVSDNLLNMGRLIPVAEEIVIEDRRADVVKSPAKLKKRDAKK